MLSLGRLHGCITDLRVCVYRECRAYISGAPSFINLQGFVGGAVANMYLTPYIGFGKVSAFILLQIPQYQPYLADHRLGLPVSSGGIQHTSCSTAVSRLHISIHNQWCRDGHPGTTICHYVAVL